MAYLRAEMAKAQSEGLNAVTVSVAEMQSVLHRMAALELDSRFNENRKMAGFIQGSLLRDLIEGKSKSASLRRKKTDLCTTALYFIEIEGKDEREERSVQA